MSRTYLFTSSKGVQHWMIQDGNDTRFEAVSPTDPVIEQNKAERTYNDGYTADRSMRRVARIPYIVGLKWFNEEGWWFENPEHADKLAAKLNSSDWAHLRTADGHLGVSNGMMR